MNIGNTTFLTARRQLGTVAAIASLGLALTACGNQADEPAAAPAQETSASAPAAPATSEPTASAQGTNNPLAEDVAAKVDTVYTAIDTALAASTGLTAYGYEFDNTTHKVDVTNATEENEIKVSLDGKTVENVGVDGIGDLTNDREDVVAAKVPMKQAIQEAVKVVPGVPNDVELDRDEELLGADHLGWKIELTDANNKDREVLVDAISGKVVERDS